jgi:DNA-binding transcriptional LysR family regulator
MLKDVHLSRIDLNLLVLFEAVLAERHVGRAAGRMHLTASAVSHGLGRLRRLLHDPLFLRTPKGVVPTARTLELAAPVADVLARVRGVLASVEPFDPATSTRRFAIGAPDGASAVFLPPLLEAIRRSAPGLDISLRQLLPAEGEMAPERAWRLAFDALEARALDVAIVPSDAVPVRFHAQALYNEDFVIAVRACHPYAKAPSLARYCEMQHLVVSHTGDGHGFVDAALAEHGRTRRVAATVPNFMLALAVIAETDLLSAFPRTFVQRHAARFGVVAIEPPLPLRRFVLNAVAPAAAMLDGGVAWLFDLLRTTTPPSAPSKRPRRTSARSRKP